MNKKWSTLECWYIFVMGRDVMAQLKVEGECGIIIIIPHSRRIYYMRKVVLIVDIYTQKPWNNFDY